MKKFFAYILSLIAGISIFFLITLGFVILVRYGIYPLSAGMSMLVTFVIYPIGFITVVIIGIKYARRISKTVLNKLIGVEGTVEKPVTTKKRRFGSYQLILLIVILFILLPILFNFRVVMKIIGVGFDPKIFLIVRNVDNIFREYPNRPIILMNSQTAESKHTIPLCENFISTSRDGDYSMRNKLCTNEYYFLDNKTGDALFNFKTEYLRYADEIVVYKQGEYIIIPLGSGGWYPFNEKKVDYRFAIYNLNTKQYYYSILNPNLPNDYYSLNLFNDRTFNRANINSIAAADLVIAKDKFYVFLDRNDTIGKRGAIIYVFDLKSNKWSEFARSINDNCSLFDIAIKDNFVYWQEMSYDLWFGRMKNSVGCFAYKKSIN